MSVSKGLFKINSIKPVTWENPPGETVCYTLIVNQGVNYVQIIYNIPGNLRELNNEGRQIKINHQDNGENFRYTLYSLNNYLDNSDNLFTLLKKMKNKVAGIAFFNVSESY